MTDTSSAASPQAGFKPEYFESLYVLEEGNFWFVHRNRLIIWALQKFAPVIQNFLEVGCGTGYVLTGISKAFPHITLYGSEFFAEGLAFAQQRLPQAELFQLDARTIPYKERFNAIGAFDVLEHIAEDEQVLSQIHQALTPQGVLFLSVPQHPWLWSAADDYAMHVRRYTRNALTDKLAHQGFTVRYITSFVFLLLPLMVISRLMKQKREAYHPEDEFKIAPWLNQLLGLLLKVELGLIKAGFTFPVGGSLFVVAIKTASPANSLSTP